MSSKSPTPPLTTWELVKMTGPLILFGILLPTVDNLTDLRMIIRLYIGIPGCNNVDPLDYIREMNGTWEDLITCQQDPDTYCRLNPESSDCDLFYRWGYPFTNFPGCTWDIDTCWKDTATFCEDSPHHVNCGYYKHVKFATMFLGNFLLLSSNNFNIPYFFSAICVELFCFIFNVVQTRKK